MDLWGMKSPQRAEEQVGGRGDMDLWGIKSPETPEKRLVVGEMGNTDLRGISAVKTSRNNSGE